MKQRKARQRRVATVARNITPTQLARVDQLLADVKEEIALSRQIEAQADMDNQSSLAIAVLDMAECNALIRPMMDELDQLLGKDQAMRIFGELMDGNRRTPIGGM